MGSIYGDLQCLTRRQLYSMIRELNRKNDCLKSDLLRHKLLSNECQKYLHFLTKTHETNDTSIENEFIKQINDLKDTQNCFIRLNELPLNVLSNHCDDMFVSIGCQTSDEWLEVLSQREDNLRHEIQSKRLSAEESDTDIEGIDCGINWVSIEDINDGSVDENQDKTQETNDTNRCERDTQFDTKEDIINQTINNKKTVNSSLSLSHDLEKVTDNRHNLEDITTDNNLDTNCKPKRKIIVCEDNDSETDCKLRVKKRPAFVCDIKDCDKSFDNKSQLLDHRLSHLGKRYFCDYDKCCQHFSSKKYLAIHKASGDHVLDLPFTCCINGCGYQTLVKGVLERHITRHLSSGNQKTSNNCHNLSKSNTEITDLNESKNSLQKVKQKLNTKFVCDVKVCGKRFTTKTSLDLHKTMHYICDINDCHKVFTTNYDLLRHQSSHLDKRFFCDSDNCYQHFGNFYQFFDHKKAGDHVLDNQFTCGLNGCEFKTKTRVKLEEHIRSHHSNEEKLSDKQFRCDINGCGKGFLRRDHLLNHKQRHCRKDNRLDRTSRPKKKTKQLTRRPYTRHTYIQQTSDGMFACDFIGCDKTYPTKYSLIIHKLIHLDNIYPCDVDGCGKTFPTKIYLKIHKVRSHGTTYRCDVEGCGYTTGAKFALKQHLMSHLKDNKFKCFINDCHKQFKTERLLNEHKFIVHPDSDFADKTNEYTPGIKDIINKLNEKRREVTIKSAKRQRNRALEGQFVCDFIGCKKNFASKDSLGQHKHIHTGQTFICDVDGCGHSFGGPQYLRKHKLRKHGTDHRCDWDGCDFTTGYVPRLLEHQRVKHAKQLSLQCLLNNCKQTFKLEIYLTRHQRSQHPEEFPDMPWIHCSVTDCTFKTKCMIHMAKHVRYHNNKATKPYGCDECGKRFARDQCLRIHKQTHDKSLKVGCEWYGCERLFANEGAMKKHLIEHTCDETTYQCQWPGCDKSYAKQGSLQMHFNRQHKGMADYRCHWPECDYKTTNRIRLNNHINKQHEGLSDYQCSQPNCQFKTTKCGEMDRHMTTHTVTTN